MSRLPEHLKKVIILDQVACWDITGRLFNIKSLIFRRAFILSYLVVFKQRGQFNYHYGILIVMARRVDLDFKPVYADCLYIYRFGSETLFG